MKKETIKYYIILSLVIIASLALASYETTKYKELNNKLSDLQSNISEIQRNIDSDQNDNQKKFLTIKDAIEAQNNGIKSQDDLLTATVAKVAPAVVSIIASKDVPKYVVTYQNPFGNDPFFRDLNIQIPVVVSSPEMERREVGAGTGFIIRQDGYILTNRHVVSDNTAEYTVFLSKGYQQKAKVIYSDAISDVAILKIEDTNLPAVKFGDDKNLKLGQTVIAIGNALGEYNNSVSVGIISGLDRTIQASGGGITEELKGVIQTDAAINPGNSGGPLITLGGEVVGINVATAIGSNSISFSIPTSLIQKTIAKIVKI